jgi:predicted HTH transcriptional regulator
MVLGNICCKDRACSVATGTENGKITELEYAERYKIAERTARVDLSELVEKNYSTNKEKQNRLKTSLSRMFAE